MHVSLLSTTAKFVNTFLSDFCIQQLDVHCAYANKAYSILFIPLIFCELLVCEKHTKQPLGWKRDKGSAKLLQEATQKR
jgi:hypothetical protein